MKKEIKLLYYSNAKYIIFFIFHFLHFFHFLRNYIFIIKIEIKQYRYINIINNS